MMDYERDGDTVDPTAVEPVLRCGYYCNDAEPAPDAEDRAYDGDPTEVVAERLEAKARELKAGARAGATARTSER